MNDDSLRGLKSLVERAVRPVCASMRRKSRMRNELLAHLTAIFEEESATLGSEQAGLDRAAERFGDLVELSWELQKSVPWWDRFQAVLEPQGPGFGRSPWRLARRIVLLTAILVVLSFAALPVVVRGPTDTSSLSRVLRSSRSLLLVLVYGVAVTVALMALMWHVLGTLKIKMYRAMKIRDAGRRRRLLWLYAALSLPVVPVYTLLLTLTSMRDLVWSLVLCAMACCFAPIMARLLVVQARSLADRRRRNKEEICASLRIEE